VEGAWQMYRKASQSPDSRRLGMRRFSGCNPNNLRSISYKNDILCPLLVGHIYPIELLCDVEDLATQRQKTALNLCFPTLLPPSECNVYWPVYVCMYVCNVHGPRAGSSG
jgi:hypothetical protein